MTDSQNALRQIERLLETGELPALGPEPRASCEPLESLQEKLSATFASANIPGHKHAAIRSLILLWHDHLDESHSISQEIHSVDGSFLHGIMHRREPDYGNAKYWFQRVGEHPSYPVIADRAGEILGASESSALKAKLTHDGRWNPFAFIEACENALRKNDQTTISILQQVQEVEFKSLLEHFVR